VNQTEFELDDPGSDTPPDLDVFDELRGAIAHAIKHAKKRGWGREQIVERMNLCMPDMDKKITQRQLNAWTATSKEYSEFPARFLPAFCWATNCWLPLSIGPTALGLELIDTEDAKALELGRINLARASLDQQARTLKRR